MFSPGSRVPNLGASGAIAGVLGSYILLFPQGRVRVLQGQQVVQMPALIVIGFWIVLQLFSGDRFHLPARATRGGVAYMAHIGGFVAGLCADDALEGQDRDRLNGGGDFRQMRPEWVCRCWRAACTFLVWLTPRATWSIDWQLEGAGR